MRDRLADGLSFLALLALGLTAGAMLAEAAVLVPYWQTLPAEEFFDWYERHAALLVDFYSPLEIASAVLALAATVGSARGQRPYGVWAVATALSLVVIGLFFVYFEEANAGFASRGVAPRDLPAALATWGAWQWVRVAVGTGAFAAAAVAVMRGSGTASGPAPVGRTGTRSLHPTQRTVPLAAFALLAACTASPPPTAPAAERAEPVTPLGDDTLAVERYVRTPTGV